MNCVKHAVYCMSLAAIVCCSSPAMAARLRYHYLAGPGEGTVVASMTGGQRLFLRGWEAYNCPPPRATCTVTFKHPCTGKCLALPLGLPDSTPQMEYRTNRVIYNYGSYTVEVHFLTDGSADVIYNSGLLRAP